MDSLLQYMANFGLGATFALLLFFALRELIKQMREDRRYTQECMRTITEKYDMALRCNSEALKEHAKILSELLTWLKVRNGHR